MTATEAPALGPDADLRRVEDRAFTGALEGVYARVDRLAALYDELDIHDTAPREVTDADVAALESVLRPSELQAELRPVNVRHLYALIGTGSHGDLAAIRARNTERESTAAGKASLGAVRSARGLIGVDERSIAEEPPHSGRRSLPF